MLTLLRNGHIFAPEDLGQMDLLIGAGKILSMGQNLPAVPDALCDANEVDLAGKSVVPGFIDSHVHLSGGGGNENYASRIPDLQLSDLTTSGITTAVSCLGVDPVGKTLESMLMKALGLEEDGITTYIYSGSYIFGEPTFTGSMRSDLPLFEKVLGIKIALADARGSQPTAQELARLASDAYNGGLLSGKPGCLNIHLGLKNEDPYPLLTAGLEISGVPPDRFVVTHVNYSHDLLNGAIEFADRGTYLNVDSILTPERGVTRAVEPFRAVARMLEAGIPVERIGMSTDGNASVPRPDPSGTGRQPFQLGLDTLGYELRRMVETGLSLPTALATVTSTPARMLALSSTKGHVATGLDADLVTLDGDLRVRDVWAKGVQHVQDGVALVRGMMEAQ